MGFEIVIVIVIIAALIAIFGASAATRGGSTATRPTINATPPFVCPGDAITLQWTSTGGTTTLSETPAGSTRETLGTVAASGTLPVHPARSGNITFTVTLTPSSGSPLASSATVVVAGPGTTSPPMTPLPPIDCGFLLSMLHPPSGTIEALTGPGAGVPFPGGITRYWHGTLTIEAAQFSPSLRVHSLIRRPSSDPRTLAVQIGGTWFGVNPGTSLDVTTIRPAVPVVGTWTFLMMMTGDEHCRDDPPTGPTQPQPSQPPDMSVIVGLSCN